MKIAVLISGGVDSSVALRLLKDQGHELEAFYLKIWLEDELAYLGDCPWEDDLVNARAVCEQVGVPLHVMSLQEEYWNQVVSYTIAEVKAGRTPSPDILCNQRIKFGCFLQNIDTSFEKIATGHYANIEKHFSHPTSQGVVYPEPCRRANIEKQNGSWILKKAKDPIKDQTYFLSYLDQAQLSRLVFPIGNLLKSQVRSLAQQFDLPNQARKDSQGICFLGKIKFSDFVKHHLGVQPGDLIEFETGNKLGTHEGFWYHTIGQRKGIGLSGGPWYVVQKDVKKNIVYISKQYYSEEKQRDSFALSSSHWISGHAPEAQNLQVKVRHGEHIYGCKLTTDASGKSIVQLDGNDQGLAPGQFAVFYDNDICLGSGVIDEN